MTSTITGNIRMLMIRCGGHNNDDDFFLCITHQLYKVCDTIAEIYVIELEMLSRYLLIT